MDYRSAEALQPIVYEPDILSRQVKVLVPSCAVNKRSLEILKTWDYWPSPSIRDGPSVDQYITRVVEGLSHLSFDFHVPLALLVVPSCRTPLTSDLCDFA
jgi:hypothetical protein